MARQNKKKSVTTAGNFTYVFAVPTNNLPSTIEQIRNLTTNKKWVVISSETSELQGSDQIDIVSPENFNSYVQSLGQDGLVFVAEDQIAASSAAERVFDSDKNKNQCCQITHAMEEGQKRKRNGYDFWVRLLSPVKVDGSYRPMVRIPKLQWESLNVEKSLLNYNLGDWVYQITARGGEVEQIDNSSVKAPKPKAFSAFKNAAKWRWQRFVTDPIHYFKQKEKPIKIKDARHPAYRFAFVLLTFFSMFLMPMLSFDYGITWDEYEDRKYFVKVYNYFATFGEDKSCLDETVKLQDHLKNYGPFVNLLTVALNKTISPFGDYETRHFVIAIFGFIGMLFTGLIGAKIGNWRTGFLAFLLIFISPTIFGHSMNNQKDIPFLAFYMVSLYFMINLLRELPKASTRNIILTGLSLGVLMSIRIGGLLNFAYLGLFTGVLFLWKSWVKKEVKFNLKNIWQYAKPVLIIYVIGYLVGIMFWPAALEDPLTRPFEALSSFSSFSFVHIFEIFDGKRFYMKEFPWYYLPKSMLITIPIIVLLGVVAQLASVKQHIQKLGLGENAILWFAFAFPLVYIIYKEANVYSSWRHVLFVYAPLVVIAAIGWNWLLERKKAGIQMAVALLLGIGVAKPAFWMIKNHPYQYLYYNEIVGGVAGAYGNYELDYWCQTPRAAMEWLVENAKPEYQNEKLTVKSNNETFSVEYWAKKTTDSIDVVWSREQNWNETDWDYAIWTTRTLSKTQMENGFWPPKGTVHTIDVEGVPLCAVVKRENWDLYHGEEAFKQNDFETALTHFRNYQKYDPLEEEAYRKEGITLAQMGRFDEAIQVLKKSIELRPENVFATYYLGIAFQQNRQLDSAVKYYNLCVGYKDNFASAYAGIGDIMLANKRFGEARENYTLAVEYSGYFLYMYKLGETEFMSGNEEGALEWFQRALGQNDKFPQAYYRIGQILEKRGDKNQAQQFYDKAQQLGMR